MGDLRPQTYSPHKTSLESNPAELYNWNSEWCCHWLVRNGSATIRNLLKPVDGRKEGKKEKSLRLVLGKMWNGGKSSCVLKRIWFLVCTFILFIRPRFVNLTECMHAACGVILDTHIFQRKVCVCIRASGLRVVPVSAVSIVLSFLLFSFILLFVFLPSPTLDLYGCAHKKCNSNSYPIFVLSPPILSTTHLIFLQINLFFVVVHFHVLSILFHAGMLGGCLLRFNALHL